MMTAKTLEKWQVAFSHSMATLEQVLCEQYETEDASEALKKGVEEGNFAAITYSIGMMTMGAIEALGDVAERKSSLILPKDLDGQK